MHQLLLCKRKKKGKDVSFAQKNFFSPWIVHFPPPSFLEEKEAGCLSQARIWVQDRKRERTKLFFFPCSVRLGTSQWPEEKNTDEKVCEIPHFLLNSVLSSLRRSVKLVRPSSLWVHLGRLCLPLGGGGGGGSGTDIFQLGMGIGREKDTQFN